MKFKTRLLVGCTLLQIVGSVLGKSDRPNVLLFFTDDQRPSTIGALGNPEIQTPNLDRLAVEGMSFSRAYMMGGMTGATCVPSRSMLHTGQHLFRLRNRGHTILPATPTLGETFRSAGYHTYISGKRHAMDRKTIQRSFESGGVVMGFAGYFTDKRRMPMHDWDPEAAYQADTGYVVSGKSRQRLTMAEIKQRKLKREQIEAGPLATELYIDPAVEFIRSYQESRPFFMYVSLSAPHDPHEAPETIRRRYNPKRISLPPNFQPEHLFDNGEMKVRDEMLAAHPRDPDVIRQRIADYYASITFIDLQFARLIQALEVTRQRDNTIIIFMGDSGLAVGQHGLLGKQSLYDDAGIGIPWIMTGPGIPGNRRASSLVCSVDLYPTLCEMAGIPIPSSVTGSSLVHLFDNPGQVHRRFVYAAYRDIQRAVIGPRYKLIEYVPQRRTAKGAASVVGIRKTQLFDLLADPWETTNLAGNPDHKAPLERLRKQMIQLRQQFDDGTENSLTGYPDMHPTYQSFWQSYFSH